MANAVKQKTVFPGIEEAENSESPLNKIKMSGSEAVVKSLLAEDVKTIFGYPGGAIMPVYDELYKYRNELHHVLTRHEQGAVHAAQGFARVSGKVGVCIATSGPGATNLITGIADAYIDSTPIVCITGQVASGLLGTDAFQETDVVGISMPVTKWNVQVTKAEDIPVAIAKAFHIAASGRPGPVLVDITKDAQFGELDFEYLHCKKIRSYNPRPVIKPEKIDQAVELINKAKKPFVVFGQGIILGEAEKEFKAFIEKSGIPTGWTILGLSALDSDHPLNVGMLGMHGNYAPNKLTNECDLLVAVGMRFDDRVTGDVSRYAKQAKVIHIEIDKAEINKNVKADVGIHADVKEALPLITRKIEKREHESWLQKFRAYEKTEQDLIIKKDLYPEQDKLTMAEVVRLISEKTEGKAVIVSDVGQHQMFACRYSKFKQSKSSITSGGLGTMGFALPAAMGAKLGAPERTIVTIAGDGGFQMTIQELGTVMQTEIDLKIVVLNNNFLGMVRQWQELFFDKRYASTVMTNPDFITIAKGYGVEAERVDSRENLENAVNKMIDFKGAYLLEVSVGKEDNVFPMIPTGAAVSEIRLD
ncbi:MAG: biosynthetic-type acetolactate synthase large subunit [Calditrichaeota bacterium]|nr:MAG: biosynthetic-type acetolactate synthase large subunit [Calditrichota bacterium]MBL1204660.1 biosynthetic-type acetolactate synthase large subunit [Calditrichota bacterium]NOG44488.1 biosynthetic-type acetolactate synthase large subunit [Calditrichota bacterium]